MLHSIRVRRSQGWQFIPDVRKADPKGFRGLPHIAAAPCAEGCEACRDGRSVYVALSFIQLVVACMVFKRRHKLLQRGAVNK